MPPVGWQPQVAVNDSSLFGMNFMPEAPQSAGPEEKAAVAAYVASLSGDLSVMARRTGLNALGYLRRWRGSKTCHPKAAHAGARE